MTTLIDDVVGQVSRATDDGASGSEAFTLLVRLLVTHFDRVDMGKGYTKLHTLGVCNGTPFSDFSREFRVLVSAVMGSERALSPGTDVVLKVVRMAVYEQFPRPIRTLYAGSKATDPRPFASLDGMWRGFIDLAHNIAPAVNSGNNFLHLLLRRERGHPPHRGPGPPIMGAARAECKPNRFRGRRDRAIIQLSCPSMIHLTLVLTRHRTAGH